MFVVNNKIFWEAAWQLSRFLEFHVRPDVQGQDGGPLDGPRQTLRVTVTMVQVTKLGVTNQ